MYSDDTMIKTDESMAVARHETNEAVASVYFPQIPHNNVQSHSDKSKPY